METFPYTPSYIKRNHADALEENSGFVASTRFCGIYSVLEVIKRPSSAIRFVLAQHFITRVNCEHWVFEKKIIIKKERKAAENYHMI